MCSAQKLNKQSDTVRAWRTPFPIWNQSVFPCPVLTVASWPAHRFLRRQVRWSDKVVWELSFANDKNSCSFNMVCKIKGIKTMGIREFFPNCLYGNSRLHDRLLQWMTPPCVPSFDSVTWYSSHQDLESISSLSCSGHASFVTCFDQ